MKKIFVIFLFALTSFFAAAQDSTGRTPTDKYKYFIATNSGVQSTPVGFRIGVLERMGGYIGMRFGKGHKYEEDVAKNVTELDATLFAVNAGLIFPIAVKKTFKVHTFWGLGYGKWFSRLSGNGQTVGVELEGGLMFSYKRFLVNAGGNLLTGDGNSPKSDVTVGLGLRF